MRSDVHLRALDAAARLTISVAFLGGCGGVAAPGLEPAGGAEPYASGESELTDTPRPSPGAAGRGASSSPAPCADAAADAAAAAAKPSCEAVISGAFPTEGDYPGEKKLVSEEVVTCCVEQLVATHGMMAHRWDCCANVESAQVGIACTPWGPPVPPAMPRRARTGAGVA